MVKNVQGVKQRILVAKLEANLAVNRCTSAVDGDNLVQIIRSFSSEREISGGAFPLFICEVLDALLRVHAYIIVRCHTGHLPYDW